MTTKRPAGKVYKKLAVKAGVYRQTSVDPYTGQMVTETVYVSPQYLRQSAWNTMQMMQRGLDVPVCLDHQESAVPKRRNVEGWLADEMRNSVGLLKSVKYDPASESHEYIFEVSDPKIAEKIDLGVIKRVSPNFHNEFSPGDGTRWPNVVAHLALTFRPKDGKQSPDSMEAAAVTAPGQKRFSVLTPARNSKIVIVPMHRLEFSVLRSMVRKQKDGEWHFRSTDYLFRFNSHAEFEQWLKKKYTKTLRMSIAGKTNYVLYFAVVHAPVGGVHINGRLYKGGQFIPTVNLEGLDQQTRQKIQESTDQRTAARSAKAAQYRNEGEDWHQAVARHAGEHASRPISEDDERAASRRLKSLQAHHGDQVMERIASLAGQESAQLAKLSPDDPKAEHLKRRLRAYARMSEHMQGAGKAPAQETKSRDATNQQSSMHPDNIEKALNAKTKEELPPGWVYDPQKLSPGTMAHNSPGDNKIIVGDEFLKTEPGISRDDIAFHELGHSIPAFAGENTKETLRLLEPFKLGNEKTSVRSRYNHPSSLSGLPEEIVSNVYSESMTLDRARARNGRERMREFEGSHDSPHVKLEDHVLGLAQKQGLPVPEWFSKQQQGNLGQGNVHSAIDEMAAEWKKDIPSSDHDVVEKLVKEAKEKGWSPLNFSDAMYEQGIYKPKGSVAKAIDDAYFKYEKNKPVGDSGAIVKNAYDNAVHSPKEQHEANLAKVKESLSGMSKAQLSNVVKQMELYGSENKSKADIINDVVDKINNRRGAYQRAQMVLPPSSPAPENRASNDALSGKSAKSDNPVKKVLGFDADSIDEIHSKLVENNPTDAYSQSHTKAAASVMINNHIGSFLRDIDNKIKSNEPITPDEEAAYDAIQQDKHFGDLREKLSDLGGAGWQAANSDIIPAKIEPNHIAGHEETYKNVIKDSRIESDSLAHDSHKMNYEDHKRKLDDIQKQLDENGKARSRLSDLEYKAQRNGNKALANKYAKQVEELDTKSSRLVDQRGEVIDAANYSQSQMARTDPALPEFVKFAHFATKGRYTGEPNEKMRKAIAPRAVQFAKQVGYDAEVGEEIAKELSKGLRVADKEGFDRIVRRSAGLVENQKKAERQRASVKAMEGYGDLSEMDKNTIENNISAGSIDSEIERIAKDKIEKNKAVAEGNRKYEQEQKQAGERKAQIEKMVADIAAGKAPENIKSSDMRTAVENAMKRKGDFRPSKGDTHRKFPKSHYTKDDMATRYNFQKLVKERGYWTDGKAIVAVPDDVRAASKGGEGAVPSIDPILQAADKAKSKARIVGEATPDDTNSLHKYLVEDQYGNQMQVAKDTHASVVSLHPDAEMYIPETSDGVGNLIYYKKDGKTVGVAVPLTRGDKEPKATVQDVKHIKEFAEPGPYKPEQMKVIGNMVAHPDMKAMVRIRSEGNKSAKHYKIDGYHGTYATENKAKEAAKELLSYIHGTEEGDETGDHIFKPKGQKTQADEGTRKKLDFHQSLNDHIASRQYKKSKVMQKGDIPEGKYSTKPGEYEVTEHDDESSPFKIVSSPYSRSGGRLKKEPTHSVVHKKSGAMLGSWTDIASAKKHAALAEGLHSWDFDKPDHFVDKKEEGDALKAKLRKAEDVIEKDEYDPEIGIPARDKNKLSPGAAVTFSKDGSDLSGKVIGSESAGGGLRYKVKTKSGTVYVKPDDIKFAIVHAPVGGTDIGGKHFLGGQFTPGQGSSGGTVAKADSHVEQEKKGIESYKFTPLSIFSDYGATDTLEYYKDSWNNRKGFREASFNVGRKDANGVTESMPYDSTMNRVTESYLEPLDDNDPEKAMLLGLAESGECEEYTFRSIKGEFGGEGGQGHAITGSGHAKEVINKATGLFLGYLDRYKPDYVYYTAQGESRASLYEYMSKKIGKYAEYTPYKIEGEGYDGVFVVVKNEKVDDFEGVANENQTKYARLNQNEPRGKKQPATYSRSPDPWHALTVYVKPDDIKFAIVHAPVGGTDIGGKHFLGGQFTPGQGSSGGTVAKADSHVEQEKKHFHVKADAHARNLKLKPQGVNVKGIGKVNGLVHGDLAVHPVAGNWVVSHIPTGKRVALDGSKNAAIKKAYLLHHGLDWSEPGPKHLARLRDVTRGEIPRDLPEHKLSPHGDLPGKHVPITKDAATAFMAHEPNYLDAREKYIKKNGTFDEKGELRSIPINTDEWREYIPGYVGTNAHVVHEAASSANRKFLDEMLGKMKGKGNNRTVILAGGGGSGKGTSVAKHFDESEYPIRIDQVSGHYDSLMDQFKKIKEAGMTPEMVFVDRPPEDAWKGVVGRAMSSLKKGEHPRTVPHSVAIQANLDARNVALRIAQENPDIRLRVIDNHDVNNSKILDDPSEIIRHLTKQQYNKDDIMKGAKEHVDELEKHGSIPSHVAKGLRGEV